MKRLYIFIVIFFFSASNIAIYAQGNSFGISQTFDISNGLSHNGVTSLYRDSRGYLWFGTYDGFNLFNGINLTCYKNQFSRKILPTNRISTINEDNQGRLWIGTDFGVVVYDYDGDEFHTLERQHIKRFGANLNIIKILFSKDGKRAYCITWRDGIIVYDTDFRFVTQAIDNYDIYDASLCDDQIIVATQGCILYDPVLGSIEELLPEQVGAVSNIVPYGDRSYIYNLQDEIYLMDIDSVESSYYKQSSKFLFKYNNLFQIVKGKEGDIYLSRRDFGFTYLPSLDKYSEVEPRHMEEYMPRRRISSLLPLDNGSLWVGSYDSGVVQFTDASVSFNMSNSYDSLRYPRALNLGGSKVLLGSSKSIIFDVDSSFKNYRTLKELYDVPYDMKAIAVDSVGNIYTIVDQNIYKASKANNYIQQRIEDTLNEKLPNKSPQLATIDTYGNLWLTYTNNIYRVSISEDMTLESVESIYDHPIFDNHGVSRVRVLYVDPLRNCLWVGTNLRGLYRLELNSDKKLADIELLNFTAKDGDPTSLPSNFVSSIIRDADSILWVGTEQGGFCRVEELEGDELLFKTYSEEDGLSNNVVKSLQYDNDGNLWIATNIGLNMFDPKTESFRQFHSADGLPFDEFWYSSARLECGTMLFSGSFGVCYFNPKDLKDTEPIPQLLVRNMKIFGSEVKPNQKVDGEIILQNRPKSGDLLELKYNQNSISVSVDVLYESISSHHFIYYRLLPITTEWAKIDARYNELTFNSLVPQKYTLEIKASTIDNRFTPTTQLNIDIKPPFYRSVTAYILYVLMALAIIMVALFTLLRFQKLNYRLRLEAMEKENIKRINSEKQRYFSNISHELRTPLTLIIAPLIALADRFKLDKTVRDNLMTIRRQADKMLQLVELAHDVEKTDGELLELKFSTFIFRDFIKETTSDFKLLADHAKKRLDVNFPETLLKVSADFSLLEKMLNNLINNAFKHTVEGDTITVSYECDANILTLVVKDTGHGISKEDLPKIFERFFISKNNIKHNVGGTGIGLSFSKTIVEMHNGIIEVDSVEGEWTTFTVRLPILIEELSSDAIVQQEEQKLQQEDYVLFDIDNKPIVIDETISDSMVFIIEDNDEIRSLVESVVQQFFNVQSYSNAKDCLEVMQTQWPDIIISDVMMPEMSGEEFCRVVKNDLRTCHIPVILLTALNSIDDRIAGLEMGADSYISKPFYPKHLIVRLEKLLLSRRQLQVRYRTTIPTTRDDTQAAPSSKDAKLLEGLYDLFRERLDEEEIDFKQISLNFGMNRTTFYAKIKALTNTTPFELLKEFRLLTAAEYLQSGQYNVTQVCDMTGFKNRSHFSRLFKIRFGVSPTHYINK